MSMYVDREYKRVEAYVDIQFQLSPSSFCDAIRNGITYKVEAFLDLDKKHHLFIDFRKIGHPTISTGGRIRKFHSYPSRFVSAVQRAAERGHTDVISAIVKSRFFDKIEIFDYGFVQYSEDTYPIEYFFPLGYTLYLAAKNGHTDIVRILMESSRFAAIPTSRAGEFFILAKAYSKMRAEQDEWLGRDPQRIRLAAKHYFDIYYSPLFQIRKGGCSIEESFYEAVKSGHSETVRAFVESPCFAQIPVETLESALHYAGDKNYADIANMLRNSSRSKEMSEGCLIF